MQNISNKTTWFRNWIPGQRSRPSTYVETLPMKMVKWVRTSIGLLVSWSVTLFNWFTLITLYYNTTHYSTQISIWLHVVV